MRSQNVSAETSPAMVGGASWSASAHRNVEQLAPPRPTVCSVRGTPRKFKLYLTAGMPASAQARMMSQMWSISRSRSGSLPSMMFGHPDCAVSLLISDEPRGSGIMSRASPKDSTFFLYADREAGVHCACGPSGLPHMWFTPSCERTR